VRAIEHPGGARATLWWWVLAGWRSGLALCSKYTAFVLAGGVFLGLLSSKDLRQHLRTPGPWVAIMVALVVFLPVVAWNAEHSWASFHFQFRHGLKPPKISGPIGVLRREGDYLGAMLGLASPILFVLFVIATGRGLSQRATSAQRLLAVVATVTVLFFAYSALRQRVEPNWPAPAYGPGDHPPGHAALERPRGPVDEGRSRAGRRDVSAHLRSRDRPDPAYTSIARSDTAGRGVGRSRRSRRARAHRPVEVIHCSHLGCRQSLPGRRAALVLRSGHSTRLR
jgi:hypothetical protein